MKSAKKIKIYTSHAALYDLIYANKPYESEARKITRLIKKNLKGNNPELLEVACGTGRFLQYFKKDFKCTGVDINEGMLSEARKKVKGVSYRRADMIDFDLNKKFDVVLCMFSSVGYVKTLLNLEKTIKNFANHLHSKGVLIIDPWLTKEQFKANALHSKVYQGKEIIIADLHSSLLRGNVSLLDIHYLVGETGKKVQHFNETHELGFFSSNQIIEILKKNNFKVRFYKRGLRKNRHLYVAIKK